MSARVDTSGMKGDLPGPGTYDTLNTNRKVGASMGHRTKSGSFMNQHLNVPGPGNYDLSVSTAAKKKTKGGTMGTRSSSVQRGFTSEVGPG